MNKTESRFPSAKPGALEKKPVGESSDTLRVHRVIQCSAITDQRCFIQGGDIRSTHHR
ncbi:hypothetical protein Acr_00g0082650 [Actinidia rufa]|uniref:Uncharacterized protein n=1 Tax=Actinidia rufa TaxID=165716 RepID=A0A7J0DV17_9ERIC|nr:hypothetical protein Acr_00g0082650 [Actinidia rufa]